MVRAECTGSASFAFHVLRRSMIWARRMKAGSRARREGRRRVSTRERLPCTRVPARHRARRRLVSSKSVQSARTPRLPLLERGPDEIRQARHCSLLEQILSCVTCAIGMRAHERGGRTAVRPSPPVMRGFFRELLIPGPYLKYNLQIPPLVDAAAKAMYQIQWAFCLLDTTLPHRIQVSNTKGLLSLGYNVASQVPWTLHTAALFGKQSGRAERPIGRGMHLRSQRSKACSCCCFS